MKRTVIWLTAVLLGVLFARLTLAQSQTTTPNLSVPRLVKYAGAVNDGSGKPQSGVVGITFALYKEQQGGAPLWIETQSVKLNSSGHYTAILGSTKSDGIPIEVFASGEARWVGVQVAGQPEQERVLLPSVPYALKAADAETVGGLPPSAFVLVPPSSARTTIGGGVSANPGLGPALTGTGTKNFVPLWTSSTNLGNSVIFQSLAKNIGIKTGTPATPLDVNGATTVRGGLTATGSENFAGPVQFTDGTTPLLINAVHCCTFGNRMIWAHSPGFINWGIFYDDNHDVMHWRTGPGGEFMAADFINARIGIGTITPFQKLTVNGGTIGFTGGTTPLLMNSDTCCNSGNRMIWAHSPSFPTWGIFYDDSVDVMHWQRAPGSDVATIEFDTGNLNVVGAITAGVKDFRIDHPLDPANKYLYHSSVESAEMMNIYTGNVTLDASGQATVELARWFEAVNADFRYSLTAVGAPAPNLHVAEEITNNRFRIGGGSPGMKVSWQVTAVRQDAFAKANPLRVEVEKPLDQRGHYLHPELYGGPGGPVTQQVAPANRPAEPRKRQEDMRGAATPVNQAEAR